MTAALMMSEVPSQIVDQCSGTRLLGEPPMELLPNEHIDLPALLRDIQPHIHVLTREVYLCMFHW